MNEKNNKGCVATEKRCGTTFCLWSVIVLKHYLINGIIINRESIDGYFPITVIQVIPVPMNGSINTKVNGILEWRYEVCSSREILHLISS
jgi:hypothetical protein